jgi:hypothetical protein
MSKQNMDTSRPIEELLREAAAKTRRSTRNGWIAMGVLVVALSTWLVWLHGQFSRFDAKAVAELAEVKARAALPTAAEELQQRLAEAAPVVIGQVSDRVLETPSMLREHMVGTADVWIADLNAQVDQALAEMPGGAGDHAIEELNARYGDLPHDEQMRMLLRDFARETRARVSSVLTGPADIYGGTLAELEAEIRHLSDPEGLTQRELIQREILITAIQLAQYEG